MTIRRNKPIGEEEGLVLVAPQLEFGGGRWRWERGRKVGEEVGGSGRVRKALVMMLHFLEKG